MPSFKVKNLRLSDGDLDFLVETASPEVSDKPRLKRIIRQDEDFKRSYIGNEKVFRSVMGDDEILLKISPHLFFEILLRKAADDLKDMSYTFEKSRSMRIPVFDAGEVAELINKESLMLYMADMLSSFTKVESYAISFRVKKGTWKKIRFNDMDIQSLMSFCEAVDDAHRFGFYKRIADICLFILGMFPDYAERDTRYPFSGALRPRIRGRIRISPEEYEEEGRKFYKLAAEHQSARDLDLSEVFWDLHGNFEKAKKPLNFISDHYFQQKRERFFG